MLNISNKNIYTFNAGKKVGADSGHANFVDTPHRGEQCQLWMGNKIHPYFLFGPHANTTTTTSTTASSSTTTTAAAAAAATTTTTTTTPCIVVSHLDKKNRAGSSLHNRTWYWTALATYAGRALSERRCLTM